MAEYRVLHRGNSGPAVKALQRGVNQTLAAREFPWRKVRVDGDAGALTFKAAQMAGWLQGLSRAQLSKIGAGTLTVHAQQILRHDLERSRAIKKRDEERRERAAELRWRHKQSKDADGVTTFDGVPVASWIAPWLQKSRDAGWDGSLVSGYRTPEYSEGLCYAICGAPSCPGMCAGRASNHAGKDHPAGAVDVSDYANFEAIQPRIGSPLINRLDSRDPVHFSISGV